VSPHQSLTPPTGRITLVALAVVAAAMDFPWQSARERWVLGIAVFVVITLLARWRGLPVTTILGRRLAMRRHTRGARLADESGTDARTTALLRVTPPESSPDVLPLPLIAGYADRYGLHADAIRVTSRDSTSDTVVRERETWIGLTFSAADNLAALQARSPQIPLHKTAEVAARRLADHLRESGWTATIAEPDDVPGLYARSAHETWRGVQHGSADYVAVYQVKADTALANTLAAIWSYPVREAWTALELTGAGDEQTLAVACAFHTDARPAAGGPLPGLISQAGNQRPALTALHPLSTQQLDGHVDLPEALLLARLRWPSAVAQQPVASGRRRPDRTGRQRSDRTPSAATHHRHRAD
jgi:type VII secretion protein EccE